MADFLDRQNKLIGEINTEKLQHSHVAIFGLGGVGGYVCELLARAGVGQLTLVDFDSVDITNINRQIIATQDNVGYKKVRLWQKRICDINPKCKVLCNEERYTENSHYLLDNNFDYVVDAIDSLKDKVDLIVECHNRNLPIISAMGAGNRYDVPHFEVVDIYKTYNDGLSKVLRKKLREANLKEHTVVFSSSSTQNCGDVIGSISFYPAMCGSVIAGHVINELIK